MVPDFTPSPTLFPFESRWFGSSAGRVHYVDEGSGRPLVVLHGNPTWAFLYRHLIAELRDDFRCVAVDYPGFGLSERPPAYRYTPPEHAAVVGELVEELGLGDAIVMGHDWGGPIGTSVAAARPDRVAGLVLGNTWFWAPDRAFRAFSAAMSSPPLQWAIRRRNLFVERIIPFGVVRELSASEMEHYRAVQPTPDARVGVAEFPRQIRAAAPWLDRLASEVRSRLGSKPVLITWPMRDLAFPARRVLPRVQAAFEDARLVRLPEARHYFQEDASGAVADAIRRRFG
ncbi:MAG: alpha/beta fold hydrolase [Solirubrobacterales bacterium]